MLLTLLSGEEAHMFNAAHGVLTDNYLFRFADADNRPLVVAAASISYNTDTVYHYQRDSLGPSERVHFL